jgi:hypothetical protein
MLAGGVSAQIGYSEAPGNRSALYYGPGLTAICCLWVMSGTARRFWASAWSLESAPACVDARKISWWCRGPVREAASCTSRSGTPALKPQ